MTKAEIDLMSDEELIEVFAKFLSLEQEIEIEEARKLAQNFLEVLFRHRRITAMLEEALVRRVTGGR